MKLCGDNNHYEPIGDPPPHRGWRRGLCVATVAGIAAGIAALVLYWQGFFHLPKINYAHVFRHEADKERNERCQGIDWQTACSRIEGSAGARRRLMFADEVEGPEYSMEETLLDSDDPSVTYDPKCLRVYRLDLFGKTTFPYHANQLLRAGGNQTMALVIQHGAMRDADKYFCSFRTLMLEQMYRNFDDILVIAPDFNYQHDDGVLETDAFWNQSKPRGDWRDGAESDPDCCSNEVGTLSSFDVLDHMLALLTDEKLYPNMDKISYVGHSAGAQMIQRYAIFSRLAAVYDQPGSRVDMEFVIANPSSYTYLNASRYPYTCGKNAHCNHDNCTFDEPCTDPEMKLAVPARNSTLWPCYTEEYNDYPYGVDVAFHHSIPYVMKSGLERSLSLYQNRNVVYMVGQNDTCNDGLPVCDESCWKRTDYLKDEEWPCFRNHMDTRCPAMIEGPFRRARGLRYMQFLEDFYGKVTHRHHVIEGVGHNATGMFGSEAGLRELFD